LLGQLTELGEDLMQTALAGLAPADVGALLAGLGAIKENLRQAVQKKQADRQNNQGDLDQRYG